MFAPLTTLAQAVRITAAGMALTLLAAPAYADPALVVTQVPEPATVLLLAVGLVLLWWGIKRRP